jgi:hypothetical protein
VVDWAYKIDPLRCISMQGVTERYLSAQKADAAGFVRRLLADLQSRISLQFNRVLLLTKHHCFYFQLLSEFQLVNMNIGLFRLWFPPF